MNVFLREIKANLKSLVIWSVAEIFIIFAGMMKFQGFSSSGVDVNSMFDSYPEGVKAIFGIGSVDIGTVDGFYTIFFLYFMLLAAIHAVMFGAVVISKEERDHCADFLFSKPVKRHKVITAKLFAGLVNILVFNLVTFVASIILIAKYNSGDGLVDRVAVMMVALFILQLFFLALGSGLGALMKTTKNATSVSSAVVLGAFFLSIAVDLYDKIGFLKYLSPFKYFKGETLMFDKSISISSTIILLIVTGALVYVSYQAFQKRDLTT